MSAEREAWKVAEVHGLDLVTVLPNFNLGPALSRQETKGLSVGFMKVIALPIMHPLVLHPAMPNITVPSCMCYAVLQHAHLNSLFWASTFNVSDPVYTIVAAQFTCRVHAVQTMGQVLGVQAHVLEHHTHHAFACWL